MRIFILLLLFLPIYSSAQFQPQTSPTQPHVLVINTKPAPNHNGCLSAGQQCVDYSQYGNVSQTELFNSYCGFDYEYLQLANNTNYPCTGGHPADTSIGESPDFPINCFSCTCPSGQLRIDGICVPDQSCGFGIQDFVTGACFSQQCPFGDGSAQSCGLAPSCIASELSVLIPASGNTLASCQCPSGTAWSSSTNTCATPLCGGFDGSPYNSIFDLSTNACECSATAILDVPTNSCVEQQCGTGQFFNPVTNQCVTGKTCPKNYDLNTTTNICYKVTNDLHVCENYEQGSFNWQPGIVYEGIIQDAFLRMYTEVARCNQVKNDPAGSYLVGFWTRYEFFQAQSVYHYPLYAWNVAEFGPQEFCESRNGVWSINLNTCLNGDLQLPPVGKSSSSSSTSSQNSSGQSSIIFSSSSSTPTGGGSGGSTGSNTSDSGGGGGGGGTTGGGGGGTGGSSVSHVSTSSVNSAVNNSTNSFQSSSSGVIIVPASQASANNSTANSQSNNSNGGGGTSSTNCVNGICNGGSSTGGGGGVGGGGGGDSSTGSTTSTGSHSSSANGECDPTNKNYDECMGRNKIPSAAETKAITEAFTTSANNQLTTYTDLVKADLDGATSGASFKQEPTLLMTTVKSYFPTASACTSITLTMPIFTKALPCEWFNTFKLIFAWVLSLWVVMDIWALSIKPVN